VLHVVTVASSDFVIVMSMFRCFVMSSFVAVNENTNDDGIT
jgi:hypothetical protein